MAMHSVYAVDCPYCGSKYTAHGGVHNTPCCGKLAKVLTLYKGDERAVKYERKYS